MAVTVPEKIRIRKFRESDLPSVFRLFIEGFKEDPSFDTFPPIRSVEDFKDYFGQTISKARDGFLIAEVDSKVLGLILSFPVRIFIGKFKSEQEDLGKIQWVVVREKCRRKGIGCRLLEESLKHLASNGIRIVEANTWRQNIPSINLLQKFGFREVPEPEEIHFRIAVKDLRASTKSRIMVRRAKDQDAERIIEIGDWTKNTFDEASKRVIVGEINGKIVGFIDPFIEEHMNGRMGFFCLHVDPKYQRKGVGTALLDASFELFRSERIQNAYAVTTSNNISALNFLKKLGFEEIKRSFAMRACVCPENPKNLPHDT